MPHNLRVSSWLLERYSGETVNSAMVSQGLMEGDILRFSASSSGSDMLRIRCARGDVMGLVKWLCSSSVT